tara:strand:+ start:43 stop:579 length:537 start_codon:yes stop_codon:yes gene_type:complete
MSSLLKANSISAATGTTVTIPSGTTLDIASGATIANSGTATGFDTEYSIAHTSTTTNRSLVGDSGWVDHLEVTFTTTKTSTLQCFGQFSHGYESGTVHTSGRFELDGTSYTESLQIFKVGHSSNHSFGAHNMIGFLPNVSAGSHTIKLQVRNSSSGTTAIMNYFDDAANGDHIWILYK